MKTQIKTIVMPLCMALITSVSTAQQYEVYTEYITNFWEAYDSIQTTTDKEKRKDIFQRLYVDKGTEGLHDFMKLRGGNPERWLMYIGYEKERLERIRPYTLSVLDQKETIDKGLEKFKNIYPDFKGGDVFFTIGIGNSGGTTMEDRVLIGTEVVANERQDWAVQIVFHEFVHTQQVVPTSNHLLAHSIFEGMADFISELLLNEPIKIIQPNSHVAFAEKHKKEIWKEFKKYITENEDNNFHGWLYGNGGQTIKGINMNDLGYGLGYLICKSFYENSTDKKAAIKEMLTTKFTDENARAFLLKSGFVPKKDLEFVTNFEFKPVPENFGKKIRKVVYGYKIKKNNIEFRIKAKDIPFKVKRLSIAGTFNNWNPKAKGYELKKDKKYYVLTLPKSQFNAEELHYFKFVANDNSWLQPPVQAKNAKKDKSGNKNLVLHF